jgi:cold shock protein
MASGTVKWFDPNRGYGFIQPEQGDDVSVHISAVQASGLQTLQEGEAVEFDIEQGRKGTAGRQPATTAGPRVGMRRRPRRPPRVSGLHRCGLRSASWLLPPEPVGGLGSLGVNRG